MSSRTKGIMKRSGIITVAIVYTVVWLKTAAYWMSRSLTKTWWFPNLDSEGWTASVILTLILGGLMAATIIAVIMGWSMLVKTIVWLFVAPWKWVTTGVLPGVQEGSKTTEDQPTAIEAATVEMNPLNNEPINPMMEKPFEPYIASK